MFMLNSTSNLAQLKEKCHQEYGLKLMKETQQLHDSINIRSLAICQAILATGTQKDEEGVKVHKPTIDALKKEETLLVMKIKKREEELKELEKNLFGVSNEELKHAAK